MQYNMVKCGAKSSNSDMWGRDGEFEGEMRGRLKHRETLRY